VSKPAIGTKLFLVGEVMEPGSTLLVIECEVSRIRGHIVDVLCDIGGFLHEDVVPLIALETSPEDFVTREGAIRRYIKEKEQKIERLEDELAESHALRDRALELLPDPTPREPVCKTCKDTHVMEIGVSSYMCTRCPVPCQACRGRDPVTGARTGAFCDTIPCACMCHQPITAKKEG
jgi:hypothetical protein